MTQIKVQLPPFFIKFGKEQFINELRNNGVVYFNSLNYFKNIENDEVRKDALEGAIRIEQVNDIQVFHEGKLIARQVPGSKSQLYFHDNENNGNVFSLYAITEKEHTIQEFGFDNRLLKFGDKFLLITNTKVFIERIIQQIKIKKLHFDLRYVNYFDKSLYSGNLDPFHKPDLFKYQNEFRVFIQSKDHQPLRIEIGSIKNITQIFDIPMIQKFKIVSARTLTKDQLKEAKANLRLRKKLMP